MAKVTGVKVAVPGMFLTTIFPSLARALVCYGLEMLCMEFLV